METTQFDAVVTLSAGTILTTVNSGEPCAAMVALPVSRSSGDRDKPMKRRGILFAGVLTELALVVLLVGGLVCAAALVGGRNLTEELFDRSAGAAAVVDATDVADVIPIYHLALTHDERSAVISNQKREVIVHSLAAAGEPVPCSSSQIPSALVCLPHDERLVLGHVAGSIEIRDRPSSTDPANRRMIEAAHDGMVLSLGLSNQGRLLASGSNDGRVHVWSVDAGARYRTFEVPPGIVQCLRFTQDDRTLAASCSDNSVRLWDLESSRELHRLVGHSASVMDFDFIANENVLATCSLDETVRLWDLATGRETWRSANRSGPLFALAAAPDGRTLACGDLTGALRILHLELGEFIVEYPAHEMGVRCLCYSRNGEKLFSAGYDGTICEWNTRTMHIDRRFQ